MKTKKTIITAAVLLLVAMSGSSALAIGFKTVIDSGNDTFIQKGKGKIIARQTTVAGVSHQSAGLRVRAVMPDVGTLQYTSRNNTYMNKGIIKGTQNTMGGVAFQTVGMEVY